MTSFNPGTDYIFYNFDVSKLSGILIQTYCSEIIAPDTKGYFDLQQESITINAATFGAISGNINSYDVSVIQENNNLKLSCACNAQKNKLCGHQAQALYNICERNDLRIFFDAILRADRLKQFAEPYGLQKETMLERYFKLTYENGKLQITTRAATLFPVTKETTQKIQDQLFPRQENLLRDKLSGNSQMIVVLKRHKYYKHLFIELYETGITQAGKIKNPLSLVSPVDFIWKTDNDRELKFFTGVTRFQNNHTTGKSPADIEALKAIVRNPIGLRCFSHNSGFSENIVAGSVDEVVFGSVINDIKVAVNKKDNFYDISGQVIIDNEKYNLQELQVLYDYFIFINGSLHLISNFQVLKLIEFFIGNQYAIVVHESKYKEFQQTVLAKLEDKISVDYTFHTPATPEQIEEAGFDKPNEKLIYLSDLDNHVMIDPVMKYGDIEIPVLTKRTIYATDKTGETFIVKRDNEAEIQFTALLLKQHPDFYGQLDNDLLYFYLHKERFLNEDWFLNVMEEWHNQGITVLGFNELKGNKLSPHKVNISIKVTSGTNWFNTDLQVRFGGKRASLKQLQKSVHNKNKFIKLDDGTLGILPAEWIEKFAAYFNAGEIVDENLLTPKINYSAVAALYDEEALEANVREELRFYSTQLANFESIKEVPVPASLNATLRHYQREGLNWLSFLDEFNFGGCLADDMGLGKSIQIIAFILTQREKQAQNTSNLIIVPTSLIFNWQMEIQKFAPSIKLYTYYGAGRNKTIANFADYEVVLTSYGTVISDINVLRNHTFNYIFIDESQNIKNPESQRYQSVRLLNSRNKIVITGTPIENNTFDLFGQLSIACPGLLGSKQYFRDIYSIPIDKFKDSRRAKELKNKINPFILRRTKKQVATELPDKTEMIMYCEMGEEQRNMYNAYEKEFRDFVSSQSDIDLPKNGMHVLKGLTKLRQICDSPVLIDDEKLYGEKSAKIELLIEQIESKCEQHKILIFSQFVSMLDLIKKELQTRKIGFEYLTGSTKNRAFAVNEFQDNEDVRVFLISLKAGGTGLNLTEADYVFLVDPWWNPAVENQAIDRCYRIGQKKNVVAVRLICPDTIEEKILKLQSTKNDLVNDLIKPEDSFFKSLSKQDLLSLVSHDVW